MRSDAFHRRRADLTHGKALIVPPHVSNLQSPFFARRGLVHRKSIVARNSLFIHREDRFGFHFDPGDGERLGVVDVTHELGVAPRNRRDVGNAQRETGTYVVCE